jgi:hypothetical protein
MPFPKTSFLCFAFFAFCALLTTTSCDTRCAYLDCKNSGSCEKGQCYCVDGYEGEQCQTVWADKFIGGFQRVNAVDCNLIFSSDIRQVGLKKLKIRNLGGFTNVNGCTEYEVTATLTSSTSFKVDETFCNNFHITADGIYNETNKKLTINYNCTYHNNTTTETYNCRAVYQY